jgi:phosphohistidine phosphatase
MDLVLWRHCDAEDGVPDLARRLTPLGLQQATRMAAWLGPRLPERCRILVSPAVRAQQTAQALRRPFHTAPEIGSGASVAAVLALAQWPDAREPALIIGHQPTLGRTGSLLLAGEEHDQAMSTGAIWWLSSPRKAGGTALLKAAIGPDLI